MCLEAIKTQGLQETKLSIIDDQSSFNGLTPEDLLRVGFGWGRPMLFVADAETMKGEGSLLCFDMAGVQRRVAPCELTEVLNTAPSGAQAIAQMLGSLFEDTSNGIRFKADSPWASGEATTEIDERSPLVRTDFSNDPAWHATLELIRAQAIDHFTADLAIIDDRRMDGMKPADISTKELGLDAVTLYVADSTTMTDPDHPILCVDLFDEGGEFRCSAKELHGVAINLSLGNMDFFELAEAVDADGVYRGS